jgi:alkaline phosphatase D
MHLESDASCPERREAGRTMMGFAQEAWLGSGLAHTKAKWNLIAQDVLMAQYHVRQGDAFVVSTDNWDGYPANRARLLKRIQETQVANPVVLSGDIHSFFAICGSTSTIRIRRSWRPNSSAHRSRPMGRRTT